MHPMHAEKVFPFGSKVRILGIRTDIQGDSKIVSNSRTESILSYFELWAGRDSNPWPPDYQSGALAKLSYQPTVVGRLQIGYNSFPNEKRIRSDQ